MKKVTGLIPTGVYKSENKNVASIEQGWLFSTEQNYELSMCS